MIFTESLNSKLNSFVSKVDNAILETFTVGFYQLLNKDIRYKYGSNIETKELLDFLKDIKSIDEEIDKATSSDEIAFFLTHIAHMYASSMMLEESILFYRAAIKIRENYLEVRSLATAENYQSIGAVYEQGGAFSKALEYYKKSLVLRKELSYVDNTLLIAESYSRLSLVYYHLGYDNLALDYMEQTIDIREKLLPSDHSLLENSYYNYKLIVKASQPKEEYLKVIFDPIFKTIGAMLGRLVTFK